MDGRKEGAAEITIFLRAENRPDVADPAEGEDQLSRGVAAVLVL